jgi:dihydropteroate synthase
MESTSQLAPSPRMQDWVSPHGRSLPVPGERTLIMGILNATPDSFSDGGQIGTVQLAMSRAEQFISSGADLLDLGGESTRPGSVSVSADEELERVLPVLTALRSRWPDLPLSIDTYKAEVAEACIKAGADIINDVWGLMHSMSSSERNDWRASAEGALPEKQLRPSPMAKVAAECRAPVIAMHNRLDRHYRDFWPDLLTDLRASVSIAIAAGVSANQLWLDPGFGFAKTVQQNLEILRELNRICALGFPVLIGTSRKSTLGVVLESEVHDRLEGTGATVVWAIQQGCRMVRVHDVDAIVRFVRMADAIKAGIRYNLP